MSDATCAYCGTTFEAPSRGRPKLYCGDPCRRAAQNARRGNAEPGTTRRRSGAPTDTRPRHGRRVSTRRRSRPRRGTQEWMRNPAITACKADGCFWDAATCPRHGRTSKTRRT